MDDRPRRAMAKECAYCGSPQANTVDHIPARSIYAQPGPANQPKVPSCIACNSGASDDDEYFRDVVLKYHRIVDLPQAQQQVAAMVRAAAKPAKAKYAKNVLDSFVPVEVKTPGGLYLGQQPAIKVDADRMTRALTRYVRGLNCWETGERLPASAEIIVVADPEAVMQSEVEIRAMFPSPKVVTVQPGVFTYAMQRTNNSALAWLLIFFDVLPFLVVTRDSSSPVSATT